MRKSAKCLKSLSLDCHTVTLLVTVADWEDHMVKVITVQPAAHASSPVQFSLFCPVSSTACHYTSTVTTHYYQSELKDRQEQRGTHGEIHQCMTARSSTATRKQCMWLRGKEWKNGSTASSSCSNNYKPASTPQQLGYNYRLRCIMEKTANQFVF